MLESGLVVARHAAFILGSEGRPCELSCEVIDSSVEVVTWGAHYGQGVFHLLARRVRVVVVADKVPEYVKRTVVIVLGGSLTTLCSSIWYLVIACCLEKRPLILMTFSWRCMVSICKQITLYSIRFR